MSIPLLPEIPPELVVYDRPSPCPYLPDRVARLPLRLPVRRLSPKELEARLAAGDRRQGPLLYRTECPRCAACEPIRIPVADFELSRRHRRVLSRGNRELRTEIGRPHVDGRRVSLYNGHKAGRGLSDGQAAIDPQGYEDFLVDTCRDTFELRYFLGEELVGVAITDRSDQGLSAVYCYYDPAHASLSIGTYSILKQLELCRERALPYLYLGLYIADSPHMVYKGQFRPHERLLEGRWKRFS